MNRHSKCRWLLAVEILLVIVLAWRVPHEFQQAKNDASKQYVGSETEWLTNSVYLAHHNLHEYGYIPLWQPWVALGEPLIENPFSFILNPLSSVPSLLYGTVKGLKLSIILYVVFTGLGGWALGYVLGLGSVGRLVLAFLMIGKGNMHATLSYGYFQLGVSQAYMAWVMVGVVAMIRAPKQRWPPVMVAVMLALMFWAGNIWYVLPTVIGAVLVIIAYLFFYQGNAFNKALLQRAMWAGLLTLGLTAITLIPLWVNRDYIGNHPDVINAGEKMDVGWVVQQYYDGEPTPYLLRQTPGRPQFYYSFVAPGWYFVLLFVLCLPLAPFVRRQHWRLWLIGLGMIVFCTLWGAGGNALMIWLYEHVALLGQWRFVGRALAVSAFWIGILVAVRVDDILRAIWRPWWVQFLPKIGVLAGQIVLIVGLSRASYLALHQVMEHWGAFGGIHDTLEYDEPCLAWLRERYPDEQMSMFRFGYIEISSFLDHKIRHADIEADFVMLPNESTLGAADLTRVLPRYALVTSKEEQVSVEGLGYGPIVNSPQIVADVPCVYRHDQALEYALAVPVGMVSDPTWVFSLRGIRPIEELERRPDHIRLWVESDADTALVITVQESAYPGWKVEIDGEAAQIESVGGQIGVLLLAGEGRHRVEFTFRPLLLVWCARISLVTCLFCILYLLKGERVLRIFVKR